jgi:hypothetical protein
LNRDSTAKLVSSADHKSDSVRYRERLKRKCRQYKYGCQCQKCALLQSKTPDISRGSRSAEAIYSLFRGTFELLDLLLCELADSVLLVVLLHLLVELHGVGLLVLVFVKLRQFEL